MQIRKRVLHNCVELPLSHLHNFEKTKTAINNRALLHFYLIRTVGICWNKRGTNSASRLYKISEYWIFLLQTIPACKSRSSIPAPCPSCALASHGGSSCIIPSHSDITCSLLRVIRLSSTWKINFRAYRRVAFDFGRGKVESWKKAMRKPRYFYIPWNIFPSSIHVIPDWGRRILI